MNREIREITIGALTIGVFVAVLAFMNARHDLAGAAGANQIIVSAKFNKVDGLVKDSEVRLGGIKIGRVAEMVLDDQFRAVVTFAIEPVVPLPADTSAAIHTDGLFGSKFVVLEPGAEETFMKTGEEITLTQDAVVVGDLLELIISEGHVARNTLPKGTK